jgi:phosphoglycerate kinase
MANSISNFDFKGKRALIRVDFNVPLDKQGNVTDDTRIREAVPTIKKILDGGGSVILMSHLGRPKGGPAPEFSLKQIVSSVQKHVGKPVKFAADCIGDDAFNLSENLKPGEVLLLENLRFYAEEEKGDSVFAGKLAGHGDVYVNDAFGTAHRAHASTAIIAQYFPGRNMFGYLIEKEISSVEKVLNSGQKPMTAIIGGAKVSSKIEILTELIKKADNLIIGGGMAYTFIKAKGGAVGSSLVEDDHIQTATDIMNEARKRDVQIYLPKDTIAADAFSNDASIQECPTHDIPKGWLGLDIGRGAIEDFVQVILKSKLILWNGPMGVFEMSKFQSGTKAVALAVATATTELGAFSLVGGGDSVAAVNQFNLAGKMSHVSTGGGAMLEYLEGKKLPGIEAILNSK